MVENDKESPPDTPPSGEGASKTEGQPERTPLAALAAAAARPSPLPRSATTSGDDQGRGDISAATLGRLLGLATVGELKLIESKIDLMASKLNNMMVRIDRMTALFNALPTGSDLERIDVQIGALKSLIRETLGALAGKELPSEMALKKTPVNIVSSEKKDGGSTTDPK